MAIFNSLCLGALVLVASAPIRAGGDPEVGVIFTAWGRRTCPDNTEVVYIGLMAGPGARIPGGGSNYVCLHNKPKTGEFVAGLQNKSQSRIVGVEYGLYDDYKRTTLFSTTRAHVYDFDDQDVPCALCYRPGATAKVTVYGRYDCGMEFKDKFNLEYKGKVMSGISDASGTQDRSTYVCVDDEPEVVDGGNDAHLLSLIVPVQIMCSGIRCPSYVHGHELSCAVCTR